MSAHLIGLRFGSGIDAVVEQAKRYADAGLDLGIVYLPTPLTPARPLLGELDSTALVALGTAPDSLAAD